MPQLRRKAESVSIVENYLAGRPPPPNVSGRLGRRLANPAVNHAFGVALRAASRQAAGKPLSPFETQLLAVARVAAPAEQIHEVGRAYERAVPAMKTARNAALPSSVVNLPDAPYTRQDYLRDMGKLVPELEKSKAIETVDLSKLSLAEYHGVSALGKETGPETLATRYIDSKGRRDSKSSRSQRMKLRFGSYKCIKAAGDAGGSRDEIYWTWGAASDGGSKRNGKSDTQGKVEDGDVIYVSPAELSWNPVGIKGPVIFEGNVSDNLEAHLEVWEEDDSSNSWVAKLKEKMYEIAGECFDYAVDIMNADSEADKAAAIVGLVGTCFGIIAAFLELFTNQDDLCKERTISWNLDACLRNLNNGSSYEYFDGETYDGMGKWGLTLLWEYA
jgi:hypothetical protein